MTPRPLPAVVRIASALFVILVLAAPAQAQLSPFATAALDIQQPGPANGTGVVSMAVTLTVGGELCSQPVTYTVALGASNDLALPMRIEPAQLEFTFTRDEALTGATDTRHASLTIGPAPANTTAIVTITAAPPTGGCGDPARQGDEQSVAVAWEPAPPPPGPERLAPGPGLLLVIVALAAAVQGGPKKRRPILAP